MYALIEGVDTCGKSTQIELLKKRFKDAVFTKEPGGTKMGKSLRELLLHGEIKSKNAELFLFLADRAEHYERVVKPNRKKGLVISDRGFISGIAYALSNKNNLGIDKLIELNLLSLQNNPPEIVFLLKSNEKLIKERLEHKEHDSIEKRGIEYLLKVQENMEKTLLQIGLKFVPIDASKSKNEIYNIIEKALI